MIIIGEKINGFVPKTKVAIDAKDHDYIREIAVGQTECGADYLDICAGTDPDIELETMKWLIEDTQAVSDLPLTLDSPDPDILLQCIPLCNKEGIINSVSMESGKIEKIFPVIADTGWKVICLTDNDEGIPDDPDKKFEIAKQIVAKADEYGISHDRLLFDPLVTTLATKPDSMANFAKGVRMIKEAFPDVHITSGLSNISFGLPYRRGINSAFAVLAIEAGMDSAIMDPLSEPLLGAVRSVNYLLGNDDWGMAFLTDFRKGLFPVKPKAN